MDAAPPPLHDRLLHAAASLNERRIETLFDTEPDRAAQYRCSASGLVLDFAKHRLDDAARQILLELAEARALAEAFSALTRGEEVNTSE